LDYDTSCLIHLLPIAFHGIKQLPVGKLRFFQASLAIDGPETMLDVVKETMEGKCDRFAYPDSLFPLNN
jgi:hypothetical protein